MLVLDFDGNLTNVEEEGKPFCDGYLKDIAMLLGKPIDAVKELADAAYREIVENPQTHGWKFGGEIMAPSTVDPYLRMNAIARKLFVQFEGLPDSFLDRLFQVLYPHHYKNTLDVPRAGLSELMIKGFDRKLDVAIVTNSQTDPVKKKVRHVLGGRGIPEALNWWDVRVIGNARKYDPSENTSTDAVWPYDIDRIRFEGFPRDTVLKRPHYLQILNKLLYRLGNPWTSEKCLVVGDIFELDLALPLWLGCHVGLMANEHTPAWEIEFVSNHPRGHILSTVDQIIPLYDSIQANA